MSYRFKVLGDTTIKHRFLTDGEGKVITTNTFIKDLDNTYNCINLNTEIFSVPFYLSDERFKRLLLQVYLRQ